MTTYYCITCGRSCSDFVECPDCEGTLIEQVKDGVSTIRDYRTEQAHAAAVSHIPAKRLEHFEWDNEGGVTTYHFDQKHGVLEQHWNAQGRLQEGK